MNTLMNHVSLYPFFKKVMEQISQNSPGIRRWRGRAIYNATEQALIAIFPACLPVRVSQYVWLDLLPHN